MLENLFNIDSRQRLLAGPMGPHLEALSSKLAELGYCDSQARKVVCTAAALGDWLAERGLSPTARRLRRLEVLSQASKYRPEPRESLIFSLLPGDVVPAEEGGILANGERQLSISR
jgi:hypothetical protein